MAPHRPNQPCVRRTQRTHGWFGLWGALLGLMTGVSGVWLNHRAVMKLQLPDQTQASAQARPAASTRRRSLPSTSSTTSARRSSSVGASPAYCRRLCAIVRNVRLVN